MVYFLSVYKSLVDCLVLKRLYSLSLLFLFWCTYIIDSHYISTLVIDAQHNTQGCNLTIYNALHWMLVTYFYLLHALNYFVFNTVLLLLVITKLKICCVCYYLHNYETIYLALLVLISCKKSCFCLITKSVI